MADHWFVLSVLSTLLNGLRAYATKLAVGRGASAAAGRLIPPAVMVGLSLPAMWLYDAPLGTRLAILSALLQGSLFYVASACRWEALERGLPGHVLYPIVQSSTPMLVFVSAFLFDEWMTIRRPEVMIGIIMAIAATYVLADLKSGGGQARNGLNLAIIAALASAGATVAAKFAFSASFDATIFSFIVVSNLAGIAVASGHTFRSQPVARFDRRDWLWGAAIGALNFGGLALFLQALRYGDLSLVVSVGALSLVVPIVLGVVFDHEHLSARQEAAVLFSLVSLVLLAQR